MKVLGIYGSPRKGGNSDTLLDEALKGAKQAGAEVSAVYARDLRISGCRECGACEKTGRCAIDDEMQDIYPLLLDADVIILASPVFFYGMPSQVKALIDRCQAMWAKTKLGKGGGKGERRESGIGYLIAVGATRGKRLFEGIKLTAIFFFDALNKDYRDGLFYKGIEGKEEIKRHADALKQAFEFGKKVAETSLDSWQKRSNR